MKQNAKIFLLLTLFVVKLHAGVTFNDIAGLPEVKSQLFDVVSYLKKPAVYQDFGAIVSHGILISGPSGSGKTLVAKAIAGEANCVIYQINRATFIGMTPAQMLAKCEDLFAQACNTSPCVVLIEELDVVLNNFGTSKFDAITKLTILFDQIKSAKDSFVVVATTANLDQVDKALLITDRFDYQVAMPVLDLVGREELIKMYQKKAKLDPDLDLRKVALMTFGWNTGEIIKLINLAKLSAIKNNHDIVDISDFEQADEKIYAGEVKQYIHTDLDRKVTAYHEAGHALVTLLLPDLSGSFDRVTILSRERYVGVSIRLNEDQKCGYSKNNYLSGIRVSLAGRAAEELVFNEITTGASGDLEAATAVARRIICRYGMTPEAVGMAVYSQKNGDYVYSQALAEKIDLAVIQILDDCYAQVKELLVNNRDKLDILANALIEKETVYASEIYALLGIEPK